MKHILLTLLIFSSTLMFGQNSCELVVKVENIKEVKGSLMVAIYDHEDHFLKKEVMGKGQVIEANQIEIRFEGLGEGIYAVSIFHDENSNGKLDSNFIGIPTEPYAFSNNAKGMFGPPSFEDCKIEVKGGSQEIIISL